MTTEGIDSELVQRLADKAKNEFASQTSVCIVAADDLAGHVGSGVILKTARGIPFLLTARHLLEDDLPQGWRPIRVLAPGVSREGGEFRDAGTSVHFFPGAHDDGKPVDVAIVTLKKGLHSDFAPIAASLDVVDGADDVLSTDVIFAVGMPNYLAFKDPGAANRYLLSTVTYVTGVKGHDKKGRLEIEWGEATVGPENKAFPQLADRPELAEFSPGATVQLGHPRGISGGAVWRLRGAGRGEFWAPSTHARLIGVPVSFDERSTEYAESSVKWASWLRELAGRIDAGTIE
ncbi:MAG: hypothetical protein INH41_00065 [Myxococcaceae bacterium]|nr:hypothetical protein [Myxococcaceae bacterium]